MRISAAEYRQLVNDFLEDARAVTIEEAFNANGWFDHGRGGHHMTGAEIIGPCPTCGGVDCFSINTKRNVWNCRKAHGGHDAIGMVAHCAEIDISTQPGLLEAASLVLDGRDPPSREDAPESEAEREARKKARANRHAENRKHRKQQQAEANEYRDKERAKARGKYENAPPLLESPEAIAYLSGRCGLSMAVLSRLHLRASRQTLYHGQDAAGKPVALHEGPAIIAPFYTLSRELIGCHITWIDLSNPPKLRPIIPDPEKPGKFVPAKKMRGTKKGGIVPLAGKLSATRWVGAEGLENTLTVARLEGFRDDTFYFAAADIHNLAGPGSRKGWCNHPYLKNKNGNPQRIPSPLPAEDAPPADQTDEAMPVAAHVRQVLLLADGDSEKLWTAALMARARARMEAPGRTVAIAWPPAGTDFSELGQARQAGPDGHVAQE